MRTASSVCGVRAVPFWLVAGAAVIITALAAGFAN